MRQYKWIWIFAVLGFFFLPAFGVTYSLVFFFLLFVYITLAMSYNIVGGYLGYVNLGHSAFFGIGAYTCGILLTKGFSLPVGLIISSLLVMFIAACLSYPFFRLKGAYFSLATFGFINLLELLTNNLRNFTGGSGGLSITPGEHLISSYYLAFGLAGLTTIVNYIISKSKFGLGLTSIREDEEVAQNFGIHLQFYKTLSLSISAFPPALMGGIYLWYLKYISPSAVFGLEIALVPIVMAMLGGSGTVTGPIIGACFLTMIQEVIWTKLPYLHMTIYGTILVFVGLFMPEGIVKNKKIRLLFQKFEGLGMLRRFFILK